MSINELAGVVDEINYNNFEEKQQEMTDELLDSFKPSKLAIATTDVKSAFDFLAMSSHVPYLNNIFDLKVKNLRRNNQDDETEDTPPQETEMEDFVSNPPLGNVQNRILNADEEVSDINDGEHIGDLPDTTPADVSAESDMPGILGDVAEDSSILDEIPVVGIITGVLGLADIIMTSIEGGEEDDTDKLPTIPEAQLTSGFQSGISG